MPLAARHSNVIEQTIALKGTYDAFLLFLAHNTVALLIISVRQ